MRGQTFFLPESALVSAYPRLFAASKATFILFLFLGNTKVSSHVPKLGLDSAYVLWICWREFHAQVRVRSGGGVRGRMSMFKIR